MCMHALLNNERSTPPPPPMNRYSGIFTPVPTTMKKSHCYGIKMNCYMYQMVFFTFNFQNIWKSITIDIKILLRKVLENIVKNNSVFIIGNIWSQVAWKWIYYTHTRLTDMEICIFKQEHTHTHTHTHSCMCVEWGPIYFLSPKWGRVCRVFNTRKLVFNLLTGDQIVHNTHNTWF